MKARVFFLWRLRPHTPAVRCAAAAAAAAPPHRQPLAVAAAMTTYCADLARRRSKCRAGRCALGGFIGQGELRFSSSVSPALFSPGTPGALGL